jgi:hypothetical protein
LDEAYRIPDTRIFIHEWPQENASQDGLLGAEPAKPICFLEVPPDIQLDAKRTMVKRISDALTEAYHLPDVLIFMREYPARSGEPGRRVAIGEPDDPRGPGEGGRTCCLRTRPP